MVSLEKRGLLDLKVTGHKVDRPSDVKRGESSDKIEVQHESYSVFRPAAVQLKTLKQTNVAGYVGTTSLSSSRFLALVWRHSAKKTNLVIVVVSGFRFPM